ncbi:MAG: hypothetical protein GYA17_05265 [Chloroflexi bacterium]|jgi:hypothetical protein|nr:hypothetical protein [Chloroflexota bacterium]
MATTDSNGIVRQVQAAIKQDQFKSTKKRTPETAKFALMVLVILASVGLGVLAALLSLPFYVIMIALPILVVLFFYFQKNLWLSPIIILLAAAFSPFYLDTGTNSVIVDGLLLTILFVGIWVLKMFVVDKRFHLYPTPMNFPLLAFIVVVPISLLWSIVFRDASIQAWGSFTMVQIATSAVMIMLACSYLLVANVVRNVKDLKTLYWIMLIASIAGLLYEFRVIGFEVSTGGLFTMWVICLLTAMALFNTKMPVVARLAVLALAIIWFDYSFGIRITWLSGWLPAMAALGFLFYSRSKKLFILLLLVAAVIFVSNTNYFEGVYQAEHSESGVTRYMAWLKNWEVTSQHFLFGTGPGGYAVYYMTYFPNEAMATHSNYIDVVAQTGVVGLIFYLWFFVAQALFGLRFLKRIRGRGDFVEGLAYATMAGTIGCIVAMAFGDWLLPFPYTQGISAYDYVIYSWMFMGALVALERLTNPALLDNTILNQA